MAFVFAFLFGLSMDFEVFVLSRMREEYDETGSTNTAVVDALSRTGRLVTSAATILCISFASITLTPTVDIRVLAFGLAASILLEHPRASGPAIASHLTPGLESRKPARATPSLVNPPPVGGGDRVRTRSA
ncbi:MAG: MMPL family transporter [Nocardioidaceae bacterium]